MRFLLFSIFVALLIVCASAVVQQKAVMVTYPKDTPDRVVDKAMDALRNAGGIITHEFKLIKGFAAKASDTALEAVKALGDNYVPYIEEDSLVSIDGSLADNGKMH